MTQASNKPKTKQDLGTVENELHEVEDELHEVEDELHEFEVKQSSITRTLQIIVYPAMVAFIVLAAYGFYLVQSLTTDVHRLTETIVEMNQSVGTNMTNIAGTMGYMSGQMDNLAISTNAMSQHMVGMSDSTRTMSDNVQQMNTSTQHMAASTYNMQNDLRGLNKGFKPMRMMSNFMPFGGGSSRNIPPPVMPVRPPAAPANTAATAPTVAPVPAVNYYGAYPNYYMQQPMTPPAGQAQINPTQAKPAESAGQAAPAPAVTGDDGQSHQNQQVEKLAKNS